MGEKIEQMPLGWEAFRKIQMIEEGGQKKVLVRGQEYMSWAGNDQAGQRVAIVELYRCGIANQEELAKAFDVHIKLIYNYISSFEEEGMEGLIGGRSGPKGSWKLKAEVRGKILLIVMSSNVKGYAEIQEELEQRWKIKISLASIRQVLVENGFIKEEIQKDRLWEQGDLFDGREKIQLEMEGFREFRDEKEINSSEALVGVEDKGSSSEGSEEKGLRYSSNAEREYLDHLERGEYSTYGGGLLFVPYLERYHFLTAIAGIISFKSSEGYGLEQLCLTLFYLDLFRFRSIENFKTVYPEEFGMLIGKLTSPSIFTIRRFLHKVRKLKAGEELIEEFTKNYLRLGLAKFGVLYIDGHFLPYYGMREITMGWNTIRERAMKGSYNFVGNDEDYNPLIFLVRPSSEDLLEKIPEMIRKVKKIGEGAGLEPGELTVIFDREGYSAELFRTLDDLEGEKTSEAVPAAKRSGIKFITWAKYSDKWVNEIEAEKFKSSVEVVYEIQEKEEIRYCEMERQMNKYGKIRAIVIESGSQQKRSVIYTNDWKRECGKIIQLICRRWGQENLIKNLKINHSIDYYPGKGWYESEEKLEQPLIDNPALEALKKEKAILVSKLNGFKLELADKVLKMGDEQFNWENLKKEKLELLSHIVQLEGQITLLKHKIDDLPKEIKYEQAHAGEKIFELDYEKKRFLDCIKVFACHMEKKMCDILIHYYDKEKELWPLLAMIVNRGAYLKLNRGKLIVQLRRFKNAEIDYAARHLCHELNQLKPVTLDKFRLPIYYEVA